MDTIHTLNTSLPSSTADADTTTPSVRTDSPTTTTTTAAARQSSAAPRAATPSAPNPPPPSSLSAAFKAAAYSVTQLYRAAASESDNARATGYQDAMEELLAFLDEENLGLGDGEGWRVRQWATQRLDPSIYGASMGGPPTEVSVQDTQTTPQSNMDTIKAASPNKQPEPSEKDAEMSTSDDPPTSPSKTLNLPESTNYDFTFTHQPPLHPRARSTNHNRSRTSTGHSLSSPRGSSIQMSMLPVSLGTLGQGAGVKRKPPPNINDYFDLSGAFSNNSNGWWGQSGGGGDGQGSGKRGRLD